MRSASIIDYFCDDECLLTAHDRLKQHCLCINELSMALNERHARHRSGALSRPANKTSKVGNSVARLAQKLGDMDRVLAERDCCGEIFRLKGLRGSEGIVSAGYTQIEGGMKLTMKPLMTAISAAPSA